MSRKGARYAADRALQIGEFRWAEDYPSPWDFFGPLLSFRSFLPGNPANLNDSEYCDPRTDSRSARPSPPRPTRPLPPDCTGANVDRAVTGQAPWVALYNPRALDVISARVGNYQFHPLWYMLTDQLWVR